MDARMFYPSKYLRATDIDPADWDVGTIWTIAGVRMEPVRNPQTKREEQRPVLHFRGERRGLVINKTNNDTLMALFGYDTDEWKDRDIVLFVAEVEAFGKLHTSIRVRAYEPAEQDDLPDATELAEIAPEVEAAEFEV